MKKYTITLDEKQLEFMTVTMESQAEISWDVANDARAEATRTGTEGNIKEFEKRAADYFTAVGINEILRDAKEVVEPHDERTDAHDGIISSEEFAREIDDFVSDEMQSAMERIAVVLYLKGYMKEQPHCGDFDESSYGVRDGFVSFLQDVYGLVKSDGKSF